MRNFGVQHLLVVTCMPELLVLVRVLERVPYFGSEYIFEVIGVLLLSSPIWSKLSLFLGDAKPPPLGEPLWFEPPKFDLKLPELPGVEFLCRGVPIGSDSKSGLKPLLLCDMLYELFLSISIPELSAAVRFRGCLAIPSSTKQDEAILLTWTHPIIS